MTDKKPIAIAFCWYQPDEWEKLKVVASDPEILDDTYKEWKSNANSAISKIGAEGHDVVKVSISVDELVNWCKANYFEIDISARSRFAAHKHRARAGETQ